MRLFGYALVGLFVLASSGCTKTVTYVPQPAKVAEPLRELNEAVHLGLAPALKVEVTDGYLKVIRDVGGPTFDTTVLNFTRVANMKLFQGYGIYVVEVYDAAGDKIFVFGAKDVASAERFMDAVAAASARASKKP